MADVDLVGVIGRDVFGPAAAAALAGAEVVIGAGRHLEALPLPAEAQQIDLGTGLDGALEAAREAAGHGRRVCLLASGDPGFFGLARLAYARLGPDGVRVHPAPSSVALAFARAGRHWDDATVVSAHGREAAAAAEAVVRGDKVAVLCSPDNPPQAVAALALERGAGRRAVTVVSRLGEADEAVWRGDLAAAAGAVFDPLSVAVFCTREPGAMGLAWGRPAADFAHRDGMITKAEVRAVSLGKLALPAAGVLWDVGAGSGSVSAEAAALAPGLRVFAIEQGDTTDLEANLAASGATVVTGRAPAALRDLPDPDRVFVGGGGLDVLDACLSRLRPGGAVVATYASPARAAEAWDRLGAMVQVSISRAAPLGPDGLRLAGENPVFVCWGPTP